MLKVSQRLIAVLVVIMAPVLHAECTVPNDVAIPDGASSTYEEMSDSQAFIKEYMAEMETYLKCLEQEASSPVTNFVDDDEMQQRQRTQKRHAAIDAMESVAAKFNEQVRSFKKVNP